MIARCKSDLPHWMLARALSVHSIFLFGRIFPNGFISSSEAFIILLLVFIGIRNLYNRIFLKKDMLAAPTWIYFITLWLILLVATEVDKFDRLSESIISIFEFRLIITIILLYLCFRPSKKDMIFLKNSILIAGFLGLGVKFLNQIFPTSLVFLEARGSHIISGLITSAFLIICIYEIWNSKLLSSKSFILISGIFIGIISILIDTGKTGYFYLFGIILVGGFSIVNAKSKLVFFSLAGIASLVIYSADISITIKERLSPLYSDSVRAFDDQNICKSYESTATRACFYKFAVDRILEKPLFGHGATNVRENLDAILSLPRSRKTDNVHNEFLNQGLIGGIPLIVLVALFIVGLYFWDFGSKSVDKFLTRSIAMLILVSMLFNSSFKDFGEKQVFMIFFSVLIGIFFTIDKNSERVR